MYISSILVPVPSMVKVDNETTTGFAVENSPKSTGFTLIKVYGDYSLTVRTSDCESDNVGSIPASHPRIKRRKR